MSNDVKMSRCLLAIRIGAALLYILFFLPWIDETIAVFGTTETITVSGLMFATDEVAGHWAVFGLLAIPIGVIIFAFMEQSLTLDRGNEFIVLGGLALIGLLAFWHFHTTANSLMMGMFSSVSTIFYNANFVIYIALIGASIYARYPLQ
ncbi:MAG: hypothetical protein FWE34_01625 [Defluviitaleaceae bacterium]|nr:hypothetical protein [Defluviitaleaceae bacterium]